jgi:heat shock protein HspQ
MPEGNKPSRDQPYYHLLAENSETSYIAYVSEQNLLVDESSQPVSHPLVGNFFLNDIENGHYTARHTLTKNLT